MSAAIGFRRCGAGILDIAGPDRAPFLQGQCTNDVVRLPEGGVLPAAILSPRGKLLFLFRAAKLPDRIRLLLEGSPAERLLAHLRKYGIGQRVELLDRSADFGRFDFFGELPAALPPALPGSRREAEFQGIALEVWPPEGERSATWLLPAAGADAADALLEGLLPRLSEADAELRRIEAGRPAFGTDMDESHLPDEVGLEEAISRDKGCYVGQEIVARLRTYGHVNKRLVGFSFSGGRPAPPGAVLESPSEPGKEAGRVTSSALSPELGSIGLGYARREIAEGDILRLREDPARTARVTPRSPR